MGRIVPVEPIHIAKDGCRLFERHTMLFKIGNRFRNIPRKHQDVYTVIDGSLQLTLLRPP